MINETKYNMEKCLRHDKKVQLLNSICIWMTEQIIF